MDRQTLLKTALLLTVLMMATACSKSGSESTSDLSSRGGVSSTNSGLYASCNQKVSGSLTVNMMLYVDPTTKLVRDDYMKLKFTQVPADVTSGTYFQFFRWKAGTDGKPSLDTEALNARIETWDGKVLTEFSPIVQWSQVSKVAADSNMSDPAVFFKNVRIVVDTRDANLEYDVLKTVYYGTNNQSLVNMDMLMPMFHVSPQEYAFDKGAPRATYLQALHPFAAMSSTPQELKTLANSYCFP